MEIKVRPLSERDVDDIIRVQRAAYADNYHEDAMSFVAKIAASPNTCFGAWRGGSMTAYLIALPLATADGLDLNTSTVPAVPLTEATVMYIHDVAVHPDSRRHGLADLLLNRLDDIMAGSTISAWHLVSVQGSQAFWEQRGFVTSSELVPNGYGPEAVLMLRR